MGLPNCLRSLGVGDGVIERAARQADHLRADGDAAFVQRLDGDLVALARLRPCTFSRGTRQLSRISSQVEDARRPSLSSFLPTWKPGKLALDQEGRDAFVAGLRIGVGEEQEEARLGGVGDPQLAAVEQEVVAVVLGARGHGEGVGARPGFRSA